MSFTPGYEPEDAYPPPYPASPAPAGDEPAEPPERPASRGIIANATFGYVVAVALAVGLAPLSPHHADLRYVLAWSVLAIFGVLAWLLGDATRVDREDPVDLAWGVVFGIIIGVPLLAVGSGALTTTSHLLFRAAIGGSIQPLSVGSVLGLLVFVQPLAETLFFRGLFQARRPFWIVSLLASLWSLVLYLPLLEIGLYPLVGLVIGVALVMMNFIYGYVRIRNGLAAAWLCQITLNLIVLFFPFLGG